MPKVVRVLILMTITSPTMTDYSQFPVLDYQYRFYMNDPQYEHRMYNTGDEVWLLGKHVVAVRTHDGIEWTIQESSLRIPTL